MKNFSVKFVLLLSFGFLAYCGKDRDDKKENRPSDQEQLPEGKEHVPEDEKSPQLSLFAQKCASSRQFLDENSDMGEVLPPSPQVLDLEELESNLQGDGIEGWLHAAIPAFNTFVFTYRKPDDFFTNYQFPLIVKDPSLMSSFATLQRHDKLRIKGAYFDHISPQKHIVVTEFALLEKWEGKNYQNNYQHEKALPKELAGKTEAVVVVHAVEQLGKVLIVEYKDYVVQVIAEDTTLTQGLYRGDKIRLRFKADFVENRPIHLYLDINHPQPVELIERLVDMHNRQATLEGCLVMFPKSPQIIFDIYALMEVDENGLKLNWTLPNFESFEAFQAIREKFAAKWDEHKDKAINDRNKMVNLNIHVKATGKMNITSPNQANPQLLLESPDSVILEYTGY
jgi:hypothetical protein